MPHPAIFSVLNNCALHALVPSLQNQINLLSKSKIKHPFLKGYEEFKRQFSEFYGITDPLSWDVLTHILNQYNVFDLQIILGPVLRRFFAHNLETCSALGWMKIDDDVYREKTNAEFIRSKVALQPNGRYIHLSPVEMFLCAAKPLGLNITY